MLSVIVPIYNAEPYLDQCVQSICGQTYQDLEIILVDDGSSDGSSAICEAYREKDRRIKVIHKENGGLVSARKAGLQIASGALIGWVDADDWIEPTYFERMILAQKSCNADIVAASHFSDGAASSVRVLNHFVPGCYSKEELLPQLIYSGDFFEFGIQPYIWSKLIRSSIMKQVEPDIDDSVGIGEDALAVYPAVLLAERILVTDICAYHYVQRSSSMVRAGQQEKGSQIETLICSLQKALYQKELGVHLKNQLAQYAKLNRLLYRYSAFEENGISPYGKISDGSRIIIFGAGLLGTNLYYYYTEKKSSHVVAWIDSNWHSFGSLHGLVQAPEAVTQLEGQFDLILIANVKSSSAVQMRRRLLELGISEDRIRWLTTDFINNITTGKAAMPVGARDLSQQEESLCNF